MNKALKDRWLNALKSGDFRKGTGIMYDGADNSYCCLGVLAEITDTWSEFKEDCKALTARSNPHGEYFGVFAHMPGTMEGYMNSSWAPKEAGLDKETLITLAKINDNTFSFDAVCQYIQEFV